MNRIALLIPLAVAACGPLPAAEPQLCKIKEGEKEIKLNTAQCYAHELARLTSDYLTALEAQVSAQQKSYDRPAALYNSAQRSAAELALDVDRDRMIELWANSLADGRLKATAAVEEVTRVAAGEFRATRALHEQDLDGKAAYLGTLNNLEIETKKVAGLADLFKDLSQPANLKTWISDLGDFGKGTQAQLKKAGCALAKSRLGFFTSEQTRLKGLLDESGLSPEKKKMFTDQKASVDKQVKELQDEASKCPAS